MNRFIKKTRAQEIELVDDSLKETLSRSKFGDSKQLTLRETLSRRQKDNQVEPYDSDLIRHLKQNVILKSHLYGVRPRESVKSERRGSKGKRSTDSLNNNSVFRFNKFENEKSSKVLFGN